MSESASKRTPRGTGTAKKTVPKLKSNPSTPTPGAKPAIPAKAPESVVSEASTAKGHIRSDSRIAPSEISEDESNDWDNAEVREDDEEDEDNENNEEEEEYAEEEDEPEGSEAEPEPEEDEDDEEGDDDMTERDPRETTGLAKDRAKDTTTQSKNAAESVKDQAPDAPKASPSIVHDTEKEVDDEAQKQSVEPPPEKAANDEKTAAEDNDVEEIVEIGKVNDKGEIVDEDNDVIGKLADDADIHELVGCIVDEEGQVRDKNNKVVAMAEPTDDGESEDEDDGAEQIKTPDSTTTELPKATTPEDIADKAKDASSTAGDDPDDAQPSAGSAANKVKSVAGSTARKARSAAGSAASKSKSTTSSVASHAKSTSSKKAEDADFTVDDQADDAGSAVDDGIEDIASVDDDEVNDAESAIEETTANSDDDLEAGKSNSDETVKDLDQNTEVGDLKSSTNEKASDAALTTEDKVQNAQSTLDDKVIGTTEEGSDAGTETDETRLPETDNVPSEEADLPDADDVNANVDDTTSKAEGQDIDDKLDDAASKVDSNTESPEKPKLVGPFRVDSEGNVFDANGKIGNLGGDASASQFADKEVDDMNSQHELLGENGTILGQVDVLPDDELPKIDSAEEPSLPHISTLKGFKVNKLGNIVNNDGVPVGKLIEGDAKKLAGKACDAEGKFWNNSGKVIGQAETLPEPESEVEESPFEDFPGSVVDKSGKIIFEGKQVGVVIEGNLKKLIGKEVDADGEILDKHGNVLGKAEREDEAEPEEPEEPEPEPEVVIDCSLLADKKVNKLGNITDDKGQIVGRVTEGVLKTLIGKTVDSNGDIWNNGKVIGKAEPIPDDEKDETVEGPFASFPDSVVEKNGDVVFESKIIGKVVEGDAKKLAGKMVDADGEILDKNGNILGKAERWDEPESEPEPEIDMSSIEGKKINKVGNITDDAGRLVGRVKEGVLKAMIGKTVDGKGEIWANGKVIGKAEPIPDDEKEESVEGPFSSFPEATVEKNGDVVFEDKIVGKLIEGDAKKLEGKKVDADGEILDKNGNILGKAERWEEPEAEPEPEIDMAAIVGKKVNKVGNITDDAGRLVGRIKEGVLKALVGKTVDAKGEIWSNGKVIGRAEPIPEDERDESTDGPFSSFLDATVQKNGDVVFEEKVIGKVIEGNPKNLEGRKVDADGEILDKNGNILGKAERWDEPEQEPEPEVDMSSLAGKRVNKLGFIVDHHGDVYGKLVEGDVARLTGRMCDKLGFVRNEGGDVIGKAELIPEAERAGMKEGPFADFPNCTVNKEGKVVTASGEVVGRLTQGDGKVLFGRIVDEDGEILDKNGNVLGKAERWEEAEVEKEISPMSGRKVNKNGEVINDDGEVIGKLQSGDLDVCAGKKINDDGEVVNFKGEKLGYCTLLEVKEVNPMAGRKVNKKGEVVNDDGDVIGMLQSGDLQVCAGKKINEDGEVVNSKGQVLGHVSLLEDIPEPASESEEEDEVEEEEPVETEEERQEREQAEQDKKLAIAMANCIEQSIDKMKPILRMITELINKADATPKEELDEEELVKNVKPLIEEGGRVLEEANGSIRGLDPDGRIAANAKAQTAARDATPEEFRLADLLKELTGDVTKAIDNAKRKIEGMPHAKKELNPLWALLSEPLAQILAAVGLLLSGVLGLVSKLLSGLGLGGLVDSLLGGLGVTKLLKGLGLGQVVDSITGKKGGKSGKGKIGFLGL